MNFLKYIVGAAMMVGGFILSDWWVKQPFYEQMEKGGILLDLGKTVSAMGVLIIVFPLINTFFVKPLQEAIEGRNGELENTFNEADKLRSEMASMKSDYERRLAETEADAREQIQSQIKEAQTLRTQLMADAQAKAADLLKKAQEDIESERQHVLGELRLHVVNLTLGATEKVLQENVDNDRNRKLIAEFIDKIEVPG